jgi:hypothetical protein
MNSSHLWNRLVWKKLVRSGPVGKQCPRCFQTTNGSVVFLHRWKKHGTVYLLPCWHNISAEQGMALIRNG